MNKIKQLSMVTLAIILCTAMIGILHAEDVDKKPATTGETDEETILHAWSELDKLSINALEGFIARYPKAKVVEDAKLYLSLAEQIASIQAKKMLPTFTLPFEQLPNKWNEWRKSYSYGSAIILKHTAKGDTLVLPHGFMVRFDDVGMLVLPTKNGSILIFKSETPHPKWTDVGTIFLNGTIVESDSNEPIYFGVMEGLGLFHLRGKCKITLPDGTSKDLK